MPDCIEPLDPDPSTPPPAPPTMRSSRFALRAPSVNSSALAHRGLASPAQAAANGVATPADCCEPAPTGAAYRRSYSLLPCRRRVLTASDGCSLLPRVRCCEPMPTAAGRADAGQSLVACRGRCHRTLAPASSGFAGRDRGWGWGRLTASRGWEPGGPRRMSARHRSPWRAAARHGWRRHTMALRWLARKLAEWRAAARHGSTAHALAQALARRRWPDGAGSTALARWRWLVGARGRVGDACSQHSGRQAGGGPLASADHGLDA
jgi:hypothetical protein